MTENTIRCLSVRQPYAWAICTGIKRPENRTWETEYRGLVAIHASSTKTLVNSLVKRAKGAVNAETFPTGVIIGAAMLTDVVVISPELESDPYASGPACLLFDSPKLFTTTIPLKGKLNLFSLPEDLSETVKQHYEDADQPVVGEPEHRIARFVQMSDSELAISRANSYSDLGQWAEALRCCTKALTLEPNDQISLRLRAFCNSQLDRFDEGMADVNAVLDLEPDDPGALWVRSDIHKRMGNLEAAAKDYARAIELNPALAEHEAENEGYGSESDPA